MRGIVDQNLITVARKLRHNQTPWEIKLWQLLRSCRFKDFKFRRQYPIGKYVVDFCCLRKKLIIELDGSGHSLPQNKMYDFNRSKFLMQKGYKVLRIWNSDLDNNFEGVLQEIYKFLF